LRTDIAALLFVILGVLAASAPFFSRRWGLAFNRKAAKPFIAFALESLLLFALLVGGFIVWESRAGQRAPQDWEFYAVIVCLWLVAAFPGFIWRFLLQKKGAPVVRDVDEDAG
jgi:type IV secretory pathway TrbF-like protein